GNDWRDRRVPGACLVALFAASIAAAFSGAGEELLKRKSAAYSAIPFGGMRYAVPPYPSYSKPCTGQVVSASRTHGKEAQRMALIHNHARRKLLAGEVVISFGVHHLRSVAAPLIAASTGHDILFIDMEHGAFTVQEAAQLCIAALPTGVAPIVRVCAGALDEATRLLDNGALGIVVPHVDTAAQARVIAEAFHYRPDGRRSWGGPPPIYGYRPPSVAEAMAAINAEILTVVMIESPLAVDNADTIAAVAGIDVLLIGTFDLSAELGIAGQVTHPKIADAYARVGAACRNHGKVLGMGGINDPQDMARYLGMGARYLGAGSDQSYIVSGAEGRMTLLRAMLAGDPIDQSSSPRSK
ncbi:MAG: HpcH/HpaI aldolase family protein, partial [Acetobacteraceae bacterium]